MRSSPSSHNATSLDQGSDLMWMGYQDMYDDSHDRAGDREKEGGEGWCGLARMPPRRELQGQRHVLAREPSGLLVGNLHLPSQGPLTFSQKNGRIQE